MPEMITTAISILVACLANRYTITTDFTALCREYNQIHGVGTRGSHMCDFLRCLAMSQIPGEPDRPISHVLGGYPSSVQYYSRHSLTASNQKRLTWQAKVACCDVVSGTRDAVLFSRIAAFRTPTRCHTGGISHFPLLAWLFCLQISLVEIIYSCYGSNLLTRMMLMTT